MDIRTASQKQKDRDFYLYVQDVQNKRTISSYCNRPKCKQVTIFTKPINTNEPFRDIYGHELNRETKI